jgi:hypothetical protein
VPTDPLTASRYPAATNAPNVPQDIQNAVFDLADNTIPFFSSTAARDTAYTNWVAAGGVMRNGLVCYVNGVGLMEYRATAPTGWRALTRQSGIASANISASDQRTGTVTFPFAFSTAPTVVLTALVPTGSAVDLVATLTGDPTASSFDYRLRDRAANTITVASKLHWVATI